MARLLLSKRAVADTERFADFLRESDPAAAAQTLDLLVSALAMLRQHPLIGRAAEQGLRELVISRGRTGYIALYGYDEPADLVVVYAIRHQREAGYAS
jgi:plasmid stabilization system protein ParE